MMASDSNRFPKWSINLFFLVFYLSWAISSVSPTTEVKDSRYAKNQESLIFRFKRQKPGCQDGTYEVEGRTCCNCAAGHYLERDCSTSSVRICKFCLSGETFSSTPNSQPSCEPCRSCSQISANLEVEESCTIYRNTVCQCKKDHYCRKNGEETCTACQPCEKCGVEGIKVACTATSNTICKDKKPEVPGVNLVAVLVPLFVVLLIIALAALFFWKREYFIQQLCGGTTEESGIPLEETTPLRAPDVDLSPHLTDIVAVLGWPVMRNVALRGRKPAAIQYVEQNHPNDAEERTLQLLIVWVEQEGNRASLRLIELLRRDGKNGIADKVIDIIKKNGDNANEQHVPA